MLTLTPSEATASGRGSGSGRLRLWSPLPNPPPLAGEGRVGATACVACASAAGSLERVLPRSFLGLASLTQLLLSALCLASRLAKLLLCLPEFALELLQLFLEASNLTLDRFDPVDRGILRVSHDR